jgi:hypothetical protein
VSVTVAVREVVALLAVAAIVTAALPSPDDLFTVHHVWLDETFQLVFEVMLTSLLPAPASNERVVGLTESAGVCPACVMLTSCLMSPEANVTVAVREVVALLAVVVIVTEELPSPDVLFTVHHVWLDETFQLVFEVTLTSLLPAPASNERVVGLTESAGA